MNTPTDDARHALDDMAATLDRLRTTLADAYNRAGNTLTDAGHSVAAANDRAEQAVRRSRLAHIARRRKAAQLDDVKRALLDTGAIEETDAYGHADLPDVIRQTMAAAKHQIGILHALDAGRAHGARRIMNERDQAQQRADELSQLHQKACRALDLMQDDRDNHRDRANEAEQRAYCAEQALQDLRGVTDTDRAEQAEERIRSLTHQVAELRQCNARQAQTISDMGKQVKAAKETARVSTVAALNLRRQTPDAAQRTLDRIRDASTDLEAWVTLGMYYGMTPEQTGQRSRAWRSTAEHLATARAEQAEERAEAALHEQRTRADHRGAQLAHAIATAERYQAAWQNARLRAKQAKAREERANARAERHRATREQWVSLANAATERASDRAREAGQRANAAEASIARVRALLGTHLGPLATIAVCRALDTPAEG